MLDFSQAEQRLKQIEQRTGKTNRMLSDEVIATELEIVMGAGAQMIAQQPVHVEFQRLYRMGGLLGSAGKTDEAQARRQAANIGQKNTARPAGKETTRASKPNTTKASQL